MRKIPDAAHQALKALHYSSAERDTLFARFLLTVGAMFCTLALAARYPSLLFVAFLVCVFSSIRISGYVHALNHAYRAADRVPFLLELLPAGFSPFLLGFSETRRVHLLHHQLETGPGDPDNFLIAGTSHLVILLKCAFTFEYWFFRALLRGELAPRFWPGFFVRVLIFLALGWAAGLKVFLVAWVLGIKVGTGMSFYVFSYLAHVQHGGRGTFALPLPKVLDRLNRLLIGDYAAQPANHHDIHHQRPFISCARLIEARHVMAPLLSAEQR